MLRFLLIYIFLVFLTACKEEPKISYDRDKCSLCSMLISNEANSLYMDIGKKHFVYDDLGCLILALANKQDKSKAKIFIRPSISKDFVAIEKVVFTANNHTPMGYGYFAYLRENAPINKKLLSFLEVQRAILEKVHKK